ncbi:MAG: hypothetical protein JJT82_05790 [Legionellaceae bacterium]|nr:hypothetical protein [Legionellaceae bacterium]
MMRYRTTCLFFATLLIQTVYAEGHLAPAANKTPFVQLELSAYQPSFHDAMLVKNGSLYRNGMQYDRYTTEQHQKAVIGLSSGFWFRRHNTALPSYALGLRFQHFFKQNIGNHILQYQIPQFKNYQYQWAIDANTLMAVGQWLPYPNGRWSPYLSLGLGLASIHSDTVNEQALPGISTRTSPDFIHRQQLRMTYSLGLGLTYFLRQSLQLSLGYAFQDLGSVSSGAATGLWAPETLRLGRYKTNMATFSVTHTFEDKS